ncbi:MAG: Nif3-like dinuclear metal center hexameric protein [Eubacteriales bacterium]
MAKVGEILDYFLEVAPVSMKESWDNVGLLCGRKDRDVTKVLIALDPFLESAQEASRVGAQLLLTHHPVMFSTKTVSDEDLIGQTLLHLIEQGIATINLHTNLDSAPGGVNDCLANALGLQNIQVLESAGYDSHGRDYGLGRYGDAKPQPLDTFLDFLKESLNCNGLRYVDCGKPVEKIAVGGGACGEFFKKALAVGCDTMVTADVKYNQFADAKALGLNLIDAGHYATEQVVCDYLQSKMADKFPEIQVILSQDNVDHVKYWL